MSNNYQFARTWDTIRRFLYQISQDTRLSILIPWLLVAFAFIYYALYVNAGLNLGGEGGTAAVIAMRLISGQTPMVDTSLGGYNVLWYFPIAWLFEMTGPNYLALRWYFFALCTASGLLVYFIVYGYSRNALYSTIPAVVAILIPGMLFRNYMPFLGVLNAFLLTRAFVMRHASWQKSILWMTGAGAGLGITFLIRVDLGIFCSLIFLGLTVLYPLGERGLLLRRSVVAVAGLSCAALMIFALHLPAWNHAMVHGYERQFLNQYPDQISMLRSEFQQVLGEFFPKKKLSPTTQASQKAAITTAPSIATASGNTWEDRGGRARPPFTEMWHAKNWSEQSFAICIYFPMIISLLTIGVAGIFLVIALVKHNALAKEQTLYPLTVLGCALTLFPQCFFFRPDTPHLSEMMVPYSAALATLIWAAMRFVHKGPLPVRSAGIGFIILYLAIAGIYLSHAFPKTSAGTIAARKKTSHKFHALNGVNVRVRRDESFWLAGLRDAVLHHSSPEDFVVCLPYSPTINFMTNRPSPLFNLYVDNATAGGKFEKYFYNMIATSNPAVVVIDQRKINRTEASRFRNWAPGIYRWLHEHYVYFGRYERNEVFVRNDKVSLPITPESIEARD